MSAHARMAGAPLVGSAPAPCSDPTARSTAYSAAISRLMRFAADDYAPILIQAESGTGKTSLARQLHEVSPRARAPFQHVVLSTIDSSLASSALFGHVAGAFTDAQRPRAGYFVSADRGTLFLDEIGKASLSVQEKLLHAIEYGEIQPVGSDRTVKVNVRIVAATNVDLLTLVEDNKFLPDLFARLVTFRVRLPALRERRADIPGLVQCMLERHARARGTITPAVDPALLRALQRAPWPHNLRQLDATLHRLIIESQCAPVLTLAHCLDELEYLCTLSECPDEISAIRLAAAVREHGSISAGARALGIDRKTLRKKLARNS